MMSHVNQGSINAKCTAGLTYQTQLPMLNTRPQQLMGQEQGNINEALVGRVCAEPVLGPCENRWAFACVFTRGTHVCVSRRSKGFSQTLPLIGT